MATDIKTGGFGGGFTDARKAPTWCGAAAVVPIRRREIARIASDEDARPVLQHRTGASNRSQQLTDDSLAHMPRWKRWGIYALAALIMSGIAPMALAAALIHVAEMFGAWLESIIGAGGMFALFLGSCLAGYVACMVYLYRLVAR